MSVRNTEEDKRTEISGYTTIEKVIKTIFLILTWINIGLFTEITGPTLKDLIIKTCSDYELISRAISGRGVGSLIGTVIGGPLVDKLGHYCDIMIAISLDCAAVATFAVPYATNVNVLWFLLMLGGAFEGVINIAGQKIILNLWKEKSAGPLHILHHGFGIGSFIAPQIANPFLAVLAPSGDNTTMNSSSTMFIRATTDTANVTRARQTYVNQSRIEWAYSIVSIIVVTVSAVFYIYQFRIRKTSKHVNNNNDESHCRKIVKLADPGTCAAGDRCYGVQVFTLLFFYFFNVAGGERLISKFIRSYSIDKHKFSSEDGSLINTVYWICFAFGRFTGLFTGRFIPIRILVLLEVSGVLCTAILMDIFARENKLALWILTGTMGFFISPLFPSGIGWGDFHVEMTGFAITFVLIGVAIGDMTYLWIIGYLYQYHRYDTFLHQVVVFAIIIVLCTITMTMVGKRHV